MQEPTRTSRISALVTKRHILILRDVCLFRTYSYDMNTECKHVLLQRGVGFEVNRGSEYIAAQHAQVMHGDDGTSCFWWYILQLVSKTERQFRLVRGREAYRYLHGELHYIDVQKCARSRLQVANIEII